MSQLTDPPLFDYARFYGLATNYLEVDPLAGLGFPENAQGELEDGPNLFKIVEEIAQVPEERLHFGRDEALLLSSLTSRLEKNPSFDGIDLDHRRIQKMKIELPLLRTDHESDMQDFTRPIVPDLPNEHLPLEIVDEEADEGLSWPSQYLGLPDVYFENCKAEKLDASAELLDYMRDILSLAGPSGEHISFELPEPRPMKTSIEPVTPPLLPLSPPVVPYGPSSDTGRLELLSDPVDPSIQELKEIDHQIFTHDSVRTTKTTSGHGSWDANLMPSDSDSLGDIYSPLKGIKEPPSSPPVRKAALADLKIEVPLTPAQSEHPPPWQRPKIPFKEAIRDVIPEKPLPIDDPEGITTEEIDAFFEKTIAPIAMKAERSIEQEQLQEADTTLRVPVPVMDFTLPVAPWKTSTADKGASGNDTKEILIEMKRSHFHKHYWPGVGETERSLQWMPFPAALGRVETYESLGDESITKEYVSVPDCVDVSTLTWKPEGLRLFDDLNESDEEELQDGDLPEPKDIESLLKKRKRDLEYERQEDSQNDIDQSPMIAASALNPVNHEAFRKVPKLTPTKPSKIKQTDKTVSTAIEQEKVTVLDQPFSALASLESFMSLRDKGATNSRLTAEHHFPTQAQPSVPKPVVQQERLPAPPAPATPSLPKSTASAVPEFQAPITSMPLVVSTVFLQDRKLIRHMQRLLPSADFIERDYTAHSTHKHAIAQKDATNSASSDTLVNEADIILSPSTGLILTTLQKIKQRSLPGQTTTTPLQDHISRTALRYERLIIVVCKDYISNSEPSPCTPNLDQNDCEALVTFTAFCNTLSAETQVLVTHGNRENLASWIASLAVKHYISTTDHNTIRLLQEETLWEIFLRRAGMNAFASQVVLSELKDAAGQAEGEDERMLKYGLSAFVQMSLQERLERFRLLLGGEMMLRRVSRVLDARW